MPESPHSTTEAIIMERDIAVYSCDGALVQWIDAKRAARLIASDSVARVATFATTRRAVFQLAAR